MVVASIGLGPIERIVVAFELYRVRVAFLGFISLSTNIVGHFWGAYAAPYSNGQSLSFRCYVHLLLILGTQTLQSIKLSLKVFWSRMQKPNM
jgi:hypothetical protein